MTQKYDKEFKMNAVKLYLANDKSIDNIAGDLGVSRASLGHWVTQYKPGILHEKYKFINCSFL